MPSAETFKIPEGHHMDRPLSPDEERTVEVVRIGIGRKIRARNG